MSKKIKKEIRGVITRYQLWDKIPGTSAYAPWIIGIPIEDTKVLNQDKQWIKLLTAWLKYNDFV